MNVIKSHTVIELSTEDVATLNEARSLLSEVQDILDNGYNTLVNKKWKYSDIIKTITLLKDIASHELIIIDDEP